MLETAISHRASADVFDRPSSSVRRIGALPVLVTVLLAALVALQLWARSTDYALRVTSDTPTFLALIPDMAERPFEQQSPFLADSSVATSHAEPYMQALAFLWAAVGPADDRRDPVALGRLLALVGIGVMFFTLLAVFLYARGVAGRRAGWIAVPVLLALFGPANVIWASDLSLHGFLYAGYFPQNVAMGLLLFTLLALERPGRLGLCTAVVLAAATMTIHPFTGVLLTLLVTVRAWQLAYSGDRRWRRGSVTLLGGFALGSLWPAYSLSAAMAETGIPGWLFVLLASLSPLAARPSDANGAAWAISRLENLARRLAAATVAYRLAIFGFVTVLILGFWTAQLANTPPADPLIRSNRLATYWVEDRWRWPLMLAVGAVGLHGLARLALRGQLIPAAWFAGCFTVGTVGAVASLFEIQVPVWYRFLLAAQVPLAIGVAAAIPGLPRPAVRHAAAGVGFALLFKVLTLVALPPALTYFRSDIQEAYSLGAAIPPGQGLVATDPRTAYYIPGATGRRVLTFTKAHAGSAHELAAAERGYETLHEFWAGGSGWWNAAQRMWAEGVRWLVIEKSTLLSAPTLEEFSTGPVPLVHPGPEREQLGNYYYENNRVGTIVYDGPSYAVYRLEPSKLFPGESASSRELGR